MRGLPQAVLLNAALNVAHVGELMRYIDALACSEARAPHSQSTVTLVFALDCACYHEWAAECRSVSDWSQTLDVRTGHEFRLHSYSTLRWHE